MRISGSCILVFCSLLCLAHGKRRKSRLAPRPVIATQSDVKIAQSNMAQSDMAGFNLAKSNMADPDSGLYTEWGEWSSCYSTCMQKRTRRCIDPRCKGAVQKETRDCNYGSCTAQHSPRKQNSHGLSRRIQDMVFGFLYNAWTDWSMCTRSCKKRRFRTCAYSTWCKNVVLMEERNCHHKGTNCETLWIAEQSKSNTTETGLMSLTLPVTPDRKVSRYHRPALTPDDIICGSRPSAASLRIVGGYESRPGAWPWQIAITTRKGEQYCGGVLVAPQWVLTAAHCIRKNGRPRKLLVRAGEYDLVNVDGTEVDVDIDMDFPHPDFDWETINGDIALVKLQRPVKAQGGVGYACVPKPDDVLPPRTLCHAVGWGKIKSTHRFGTDILREAPVPLVEKDKCRSAFEYDLTESQMCAGYRRGGIDTCAGDSGGPLMCEVTRDGETRWHVYGITSFGEGCALKGKYGIYTEVTLYSDWIRNITTTNQ